MRKSILAQFKIDLYTALERFELNSGGRHNHRPDIVKALDTIEEYIHRAQNPLILLNTIETYIKNYLSGFFQSFFFRDEYQIKKHVLAILNQPEYSLQALSHALYHENEAERLSLYRLISQLEERLKNIESGREDTDLENTTQTHSSEFEDLRSKIKHLEACEQQAHQKISDLENEKWIKAREIIVLQAKIESLSNENNELQKRNKELQEKLEKNLSQFIHQNPIDSEIISKQILQKKNSATLF